MKKLLAAALLALAANAGAESLKTVFNPQTGKSDYITAVNGTNFVSGSGVTVSCTNGVCTFNAAGSSASNLQTTISGAQVSSPTASLNLYGGDFLGSLAGGTTALIYLNPATTDYIHNQATPQSATLNVTSGTVSYMNTSTTTANFGFFSNKVEPGAFGWPGFGYSLVVEDSSTAKAASILFSHNGSYALRNGNVGVISEALDTSAGTRALYFGSAASTFGLQGAFYYTYPTGWANSVPIKGTMTVDGSLAASQNVTAASATVAGQLTSNSMFVTGLTSGQCVQTGTGGQLTVTGSACGAGGAGDNLGNGTGSFGVSTSSGGFTSFVSIAGPLTNTSSTTITGAGGLGVTYGVAAGSVTASSATFTTQVTVGGSGTDGLITFPFGADTYTVPGSSTSNTAGTCAYWSSTRTLSSVTCGSAGTITISGDSSGSGTTSIALTAAALQNNITTFGSSITIRGAGINNLYGIVTSSVAASSITVSGQTVTTGITINELTASRPMLSDTNKKASSGQIDFSNTNHVTGTMAAAQEPAHTGDVTNSAGSLAMTAAATQANIKTFTSAITNTSSVTVTGAGGVKVSFGVVAATASVTSTATITSLQLGTTDYGTYKSSSTLQFDASLGNIGTVILTSSVTIHGPLKPRDGQKFTFRITQDAAGGRIVNWYTGSSGEFAFGSDITSLTASTGASKVDYVGAIYSAASGRWHIVSKSFGF